MRFRGLVRTLLPAPRSWLSCVPVLALGKLEKSKLLFGQRRYGSVSDDDILGKHFLREKDAAFQQFAKGTESSLSNRESLGQLQLNEETRTLSMSWVREMMAALTIRAQLSDRARAKAVPVPKRVLMQLLELSLQQFNTLPSVIPVRIPLEGNLNVCGDTHGQFFDLLNIFSSSVASWPSKDNVFMFNGDFVDRGIYSFEVILALLALKLADPETMHLLRGNHETTNMNSLYGFEKQIVAGGYDREVLEAFRRVFDALPLAAVVESTALVVHGGIGPLTSRMTVAQLSELDRFSYDLGSDADTVSRNDLAVGELLWADPIQQTTIDPLTSSNQVRGFKPNTARGGGQQFGPDITHSFLSLNKLGLLLRSHECRMDGFSVDHDLSQYQEEEETAATAGAAQGYSIAPKRCITVFSAPNYCDAQGNLGAYVRFSRVNTEEANATTKNKFDLSGVQVLYGGRIPNRNVEYCVVQFPAVPHPHSSATSLRILGRQQQMWTARKR